MTELIPIGRDWYLEYIDGEYVRHVYLGPKYAQV